MSERRLAARPRLTTFRRYFCNVKRRMRLTPPEWNNAVENAAGWCMRQLALGYGWETVSYEGRAFAWFLRPLALRPTPPPEASVYPSIFSLRWMQTSQPRAFTRRLRRARAPERVHTSALIDFCHSRRWKSFAISAQKKKKKNTFHVLIYLARNVADWRKIISFPVPSRLSRCQSTRAINR